jgi:Protein phosphatase 2C
VIRNVNALAVTEKGPTHRLNGEPNQDTCLRSGGQYGMFVVVADGLGSRPQSDRGSRSACLAARDAVRYWSANPLSSPERLAPLIQALWRVRIAPLHPDECATTCLFALRQPTGQWVVGGIGDGMAAIREDEHDISYVMGRERTGFNNQTVGLGASKSASDWRFCASRYAFIDDAFVPPHPVSQIPAEIEEVTAIQVYAKHPKEEKFGWRAITISAGESGRR